MTGRISDEMIEYVGILAKLELSAEEKAAAKEDMEKMLGYIDILNEIDTSETEPLVQVFQTGNVLREDVVTNENNRENVLKNAPRKMENCFVVPKTIG